MDSGTENDFLARALGGDKLAFERLFAPYAPMLFAYSRTICGDHHAAQDVVQETAVIAYRKLNHLFPEADFGGWLKSIARRQALAARRKLGRVALVAEELLEQVYVNLEPDGEGLELEALNECLRRLAGRMNQVVRGHYFEGRPLADIAQAMELSVGAVKQLMYRSRLWLRDCVEKRLGLEESS